MAFHVESRLGRGRSVETFAAVLEVGPERLDVVVKRARPEFSKNAAFQDALEAWGKAQIEADHEHLVAVLEAGRTGEGVYVIQEKVEGAALATVLKALRQRKRTLKPAFALIIAEQVASALAYLHRDLGTPHGGIDPGDVIIGYDGVVKLGDQKLHELDHHVGSDLVEGDDRIDYLAPELATKGAKPTIKGDLYALALLVLETLIGHPVWTAESMTVDGTLDALRDFSPLGQAQPALTQELSEVLAGCLRQIPEQRPISSVPIAGAIADLMNRHGINADGAGLGKFVEALVPPPEAEEAPTRMVDAAFAEEIQRQQDERLSQFEGASVAINPEIERQAGLPKRAMPLVGAPLELGLPAFEAPPSKIPPAPPPEPVAPPPPAPPAPAPARHTTPRPVAPSVKRDVAVPNVHRVAAQASSALDEKQGKLLLIVAAILIGIGLIVAGIFATGSNERTVRLRATSIPQGASVYAEDDDRLLGRTPLEIDTVIDGELIHLRFELDAHEPHRATIGSDSGEIRYEARLSPVADTP